MFKRKNKKPIRRRAVIAAENEAAASEARSFRRNRTLTGSLLSSVSSPNEHAATLKSPRVQAHSLRRDRRKIGFFLFWLVVFIAVIIWVLAQLIVIPSVKIVGLSNPPESVRREYETALQDYLTNHPLERLEISIDDKQITRHMQSRFPEILYVSKPEKPGFGAATFSIGLRSPTVLWRSGNSDVFVDENGVIFKRNILGKSVLAIEDRTGADLGRSGVVSTRFMQFIGKTTGYFKDSGFEVVKIILPEGTARQIQISLDGVDYYVKMSVDRQAAGQVEDAIRAIRYFRDSGMSPEYVDVRVSRRAFYR